MIIKTNEQKLADANSRVANLMQDILAAEHESQFDESDASAKMIEMLNEYLVVAKEDLVYLIKQ